MGVNNRQRRAAKRRKNARAGKENQAGRSTQQGYGQPYGDHLFGYQPYADQPFGYQPDTHRPSGHQRDDLIEDGVAAQLLEVALEEMEVDRGAAGKHAELLLGRESRVSPRAVARVLDGLLTEVITAVVRGGWTPTDLGHIVRRRASAGHVPALAALLARETDRHRAERVSTAWRDDLCGLGEPVVVDLRTTAGLETALTLAGVLGMLPVIPEVLPRPGSARRETGPASTSADSKQLSKVRGLLAKAESTEYAEEAEALSAKAQELITRHALERLIHRSEEEERSDDTVVSRRIWIDAPYVVAKAILVDAVADANRCRSILDQGLGFCTVIGEAVDLDSVELLSTSLLVQANTAMLHHGRHVDHRGTSRTQSFRRSFLTSYASRIGDRLQAATAHAAEDSGRADALLPVLRQQAEHVDDAFAEMFPEVVHQTSRITNGHGWAAGRAAADLALLDHRAPVSASAGY